MQSRVIPIVSRSVFDFSDVASGQSTTIVAAEHVDVACFGDAVLLVRVHANATTGTSTIVVRAYSVSFTEEDPDVTFLAPSPAAAVTIGNGTSVAAGSLLLAGAEDAFGGSLQIHVVGFRVGSDTVRAEISIDLVARVGVPGPRRSLADTLLVGNETDGTDILVEEGDGVGFREADGSTRWRWHYVPAAGEDPAELRLDEHDDSGVLVASRLAARFGGLCTWDGQWNVNGLLASFGGASLEGGDVTTGSGHSFINAGGTCWAGSISNTLAAGNNNDVSPTFHPELNALRFTPNAGGSTITGVVAGDSGQMQLWINVSTSTSITIAHEDTNSTAANRILCPSSANLTLRPNAFVRAWYDGTSQRWRIS